MNDITLCIATLPNRATFLRRALDSVQAQVVKPTRIVVEMDWLREGAAQTRNRAMRGAWTTWLAFLDDDDELYSDHFEHLLSVAIATDADLVYPWYEARRNGVPIPDPVVGRGAPFDAELLMRHNCIPPEVIVKRELVESVGGFPVPGSPSWPHPDCEDWGLWQAVSATGAKIVHTPEITWVWHHHDAHTRGLPR